MSKRIFRNITAVSLLLLLTGRVYAIDGVSESHGDNCEASQTTPSPHRENIMTLAEALKGHVYKLAQEIGERNVFQPQALHQAEEYIRQTWKEQGYEVLEQEYTLKGVRSANIEVNKTGTTKHDEIILIGAHYDSVTGSPGANDNGSGVAALLEMSRLLRDVEMQRSVRFVAFVNEEPPFFFTRQQGSRVYARAVRKRGDNIRLMLSLETMGYFRDEPRSQRYPPLFRYFYPDKGNFIALVSNFRSRKLMYRLAEAFRAESDFPLHHVATFSIIPGVGWSDHLSFWMNGYRALMVTDTAFYRYPWYHAGEDSAEKLDYPRLAEVTDGLVKAVIQLTNSGEL